MNFKRTDLYRSLFLLLAALLLLSMVGLCVHRADAADATLNWTHPTQRTDNTALALSEIKETEIQWGVCATGNTFPATPAGTKAVPAPATTTVISGLAYGTWCFRARTVPVVNPTTDQSAWAGPVWVVYLAPPKPPVLSTVITVVYEIKSHPVEGTMLGRNVGSVKLGTPCLPEPIVYTNGGTYYEVSLDTVTLTKMPKSAIVVTKCEAT